LFARGTAALRPEKLSTSPAKAGDKGAKAKRAKAHLNAFETTF
jgi:hypothetical protein